jgi:hypothetical protein
MAGAEGRPTVKQFQQDSRTTFLSETATNLRAKILGLEIRASGGCLPLEKV